VQIVVKCTIMKIVFYRFKNCIEEIRKCKACTRFE